MIQSGDVEQYIVLDFTVAQSTKVRSVDITLPPS
jgi:hypothetical protein